MVEEGDCGLLLPPEPESGRRMYLSQVWSRSLSLAAAVLLFMAFVSVSYFATIEIMHSMNGLPETSNKTSLEWHLSDLFPGPCLSFRTNECDTDCRQGETAVCGQCHRFACWCAWYPGDRNHTMTETTTTYNP